jgi:hypothetical protein
LGLVYLSIEGGCLIVQSGMDTGLDMVLTSESRDLAGRLLRWEANATDASGPRESVAIRVYEKLRGRLCALAGAGGFYSLASRALTLAKSDSLDLVDVQIATDGSLQGIGERYRQIESDTNKWGEDETILIARLLGMLLIFLGEALTLNLISDLWPDAGPDDRVSGNGRRT